jgi:predicted Ser/Thr protein kinase
MTMPERILQDRYEVLSRLGEGGFATTWLARDRTTGKQCVVKEVSVKRAEDEKSIELFEREGQALKQLGDHPQIPDFIDFFELPTDKDYGLFLVQEYVPGRNLAEMLKSGKRFSEKEAIDIALGLIDVLEFLHGFSPPFIHRDIKPSNVMLADGKVYLIDFGAIRDKMMLDKERAGGGSTFVGTYGYIPYEQYAGRALPASDIYALGMTLIALLSGQEPMDLEQRRMRFVFRPHVQVSSAFADVLEKTIEPEPEKRYGTVQELRATLRRVQAGQPAEEPAVLLKRARARRRVLLGMLALALGALAYRYWLAPPATSVYQTAFEKDQQGPSREAGIRRKYTSTEAEQLPQVALGVNLIANPGLEGPAQWNHFPGYYYEEVVESQNVHSGKHCLAIHNEQDFFEQNVSLSPLAREIGTGRCTVTISAAMRSKRDKEAGAAYLYVLPRKDATGLCAGDTIELELTPSTNWTVRSKTVNLPPHTRLLTLCIKSGKERRPGSPNVAYFDDISVVVHKR